MSRASDVLLAALTEEPATTSALYERVGYAALVEIGLVPYDAFRAELGKLSAAGLAETGTDDDGATLWRVPMPPEETGEGDRGADGAPPAGG